MTALPKGHKTASGVLLKRRGETGTSRSNVRPTEILSGTKSQEPYRRFRGGEIALRSPRSDLQMFRAPRLLGVSRSTRWGYCRISNFSAV